MFSQNKPNQQDLGFMKELLKNWKSFYRHSIWIYEISYAKIQ
jgi:hypothetical protein